MDRTSLKKKMERFNFEEASKRLKGVLKNTDLIYSDAFGENKKNNIYIKPENLQKTGSFKIRGAYNKIYKLSEDEKSRGLIASSAGNHAQGVAYAAKKLGAKATIVMPEASPLIKIEATKSYGAKVILHGDCYDEAYEEANRLGKENGYIFVHPFNDIDVIEGQGTIAYEIYDELPKVDYIIVPIGGGGLISGVAVAAKRINPDIKIIGVEPEGAQTLSTCLDCGSLTSLEYVKTIADGVAVKEAGDLTFEITKSMVDEIVVVSDFEIMVAFLILLDQHKLVGENAGVMSLAAINKLEIENKNIVSIVSGGNIDVLTMSSMISRGLINRGRIFSFSIDLQDRPGELEKISKILAEQNANVIKLEHNQIKSIDRFMEVQLEVTVETNGKAHINKIVKSLSEKGYEIERM